jgi:hypothetical protein
MAAAQPGGQEQSIAGAYEGYKRALDTAGLGSKLRARRIREPCRDARTFLLW